MQHIPNAQGILVYATHTHQSIAWLILTSPDMAVSLSKPKWHYFMENDKPFTQKVNAPTEFLTVVVVHKRSWQDAGFKYESLEV